MWRRILYGCTIFTSALLLFLVQPMMAKAILPWFGGSAGVWTTAMLFFQALLLGGYWYAHRLAGALSARAQAGLHAALLAASLAVLPVVPGARWKPSGVGHPVLEILLLLAVTVGFPYLLLATTTPLVQSWYAREAGGRSPYRLFAISNLASLAALLAYPVAIEPVLPVRVQLWLWSGAYALFVLLCGASALAGMGRATLPAAEERAAPWHDRLLWMALAACPSALWLAVANQLSQSVAPMPFIWILPLSLYLLSFILCFDRSGWYNPRLFRWLLPASVLAICYGLAEQSSSFPLRWTVLLFGAGLFGCAMFCHGELAKRKPEPAALTSYYLMLAAGGAAGGAFVAVLAPVVFTGYYELQVALTGCVILALTMLYGYARPRQVLRLALVASAGFAMAFYLRSSLQGNVRRARGFYGAVEVADGRGPRGLRVLYNGAIIHGSQFLAPERSRTATAYYGPSSGAALALRYRPGPGRRVGVIGLGTGTLAVYGRAGDTFRFYEINPLVIELANHSFRYLKESAARIEIVPGDARLSLEREPGQAFDVLMVDAFSGDSIPVHLLTREAFALYRRHLNPGGIIAVHLTNKYLDLVPVVSSVVATFGKRAMAVRSPGDGGALYGAIWMLITDDPVFAKVASAAANPDEPTRILRAWTDDYSNLFRILR